MNTLDVYCFDTLIGLESARRNHANSLNLSVSIDNQQHGTSYANA
jgi:hypothetical protein